MKTKLKSCPFCGENNYGMKRHDFPFSYLWAVRCDCGARGPYEKGKISAKSCWNRRAHAKGKKGRKG